MRAIIYSGPVRFSRFFLLNPFSGQLERCSEKDFDDIVVQFRNHYDLEYDGNAQNFLIDGIVQARRERG